MTKKLTIPTGPIKGPSGIQRMPMRYCKRCGQPLLWCTSGPNGEAIEPAILEEAMKLRVCAMCYKKEMEDIDRDVQKLIEQQKKIEDEKYEQAVQKIMDDLKKRSEESKDGADAGTDTRV